MLNERINEASAEGVRRFVREHKSFKDVETMCPKCGSSTRVKSFPEKGVAFVECSHREWSSKKKCAVGCPWMRFLTGRPTAGRRPRAGRG